MGWSIDQVHQLTKYDPWFIGLDKPSIFPPPLAFGIVWPLLYTAMGFSIAIVCAAWGSRYRLVAILAFVLQLELQLADQNVHLQFDGDAREWLSKRG